ncbi:hypothetical protein HU200_066987 [Digitaria exilis]|uniref:Uncharacterized protein n=1 Tax=Digitaria exilis TaxID=1010633 RepID=A0A835DTD2_9POAL|nr:hypothetical protein HU200_066987 [Digitaria exilis]
MGCYPPLEWLDKFVSKALGKCNGAYKALLFLFVIVYASVLIAGRDRWRRERLDYSLAYPPGAPTEIHYVQPVARTVTFASNNSVYVIPPSPPPQPKQQQSPPQPEQPQTPPQHEPEPEQHHNAPQSQPQPQPEQPAAEPPAETQDAPPPPSEPKPPKGQKRGKKKHSGRVRFGPEPPPPQQEEQSPQQQHEEEEHAQGPGDSGGNNAPDHQQQKEPHGAAPAPPPAHQGHGYLLRYTPSPLPRWEATPRRHEYFSGEYRSYYPTPVREGIYRIATDANRLTTIFSEENPNACTIV